MLPEPHLAPGGVLRAHGVQALLAHWCVASLALLVQGMLLIRYVGVGDGEGLRGPLVGLLVLAGHVAFLVRSGMRDVRQVLLLAAALMLYVLVTLMRYLAAPPLEYGHWKIVGFGLYAVLPSIMAAASFGGRPRLVRLFLLWLLGLAFLPLLPLVAIVPRLGTGPVRWLLHEAGVDLISISRSLGLGIVVASTLALASRGRRSAWLIGGASVLAASQIIIGERGPMLATVPALVYAIWGLVWKGDGASRRSSARLAGAAAMLLMACGAVAWVLWTRHAVGAEEGRLSILAHAWNAFVASPLVGIGVGAFRYEDGISGFRQYAHCLPLEIVVETGLVGLIASVAYFAVALRNWDSGLVDATRRIALVPLACRCVFLYAFVAAMISGDLVTNYMVWVAAALVNSADDRTGSTECVQ